MEAEDDFVQKVDDSMGKMKAVVDNGDSLKCLSGSLELIRFGCYSIAIS
jgi:hypothetical protein